jgi:glycosyltransferase involved in cell wall biosynthesis
LAKELAKKHEVMVLTANLGSKELNELNNFVVKKISLKNSIWRSKGFYEFLKKIPKEIDLKEFDAVHVMSPSFGVFLKKNSFFTTAHGSSISELKSVLLEGNLSIVNFSRILKSYFLEFIGFRKAKKIFSISKLVESEAKKHYFLTNKFELVYWGVDLKKFFPLNKKGDFVLFVGRLSERKGLSVLLNAFKNLNEKLLIVGDGDLKQWIKKFIKKNGLNERIKLIEWLAHDKIIELYQQCNLLILPSNYDGFGLVGLEAMACGKPVIASTATGISEIIENGFNGFIFRKGNSIDLKEKIELILNDSFLMKKLSKNARKTAEKFSWANTAKNYERVFSSEKT